MAEIVVKLVNGELAGKTAQTIAKEVNSAALAMKKAEIGSKEWAAAHQKLESAKKLQIDLKKQIEGTAKASDTLKNAWNKLPGASFFNQITDSFKTAKSGVGGLVSSMGVLKSAIVATGIGALVLAVMALFQWFTKTESGADLMAKAMAVVDSVFRQVTESISRLMNGDIIGFFKGMTSEMVEQTKAASELADVMDQLEEKESAFQVVQKAGMRDKAELLKMSKEETRSLEDRIKAIDKATGITIALNKQELDNQREHLKIISGGTAAITDAQIKRLEATGITMENAKDFFKKGNITQDDLNEANQALAKFLEIQQSAFDEERELLVQRNKLIKKEDGEVTKTNKAEADERARIKKEEEKVMGDYYKELKRQQEEYDLYLENRKAADAEKEKNRIKDSMLLAAQQLASKVSAINEEIAEREKLNNAIKLMEQTKLDLFNEGTNAIIQLLSTDEAARKKNAQAIKFFTLGQIAVNLQDEIQGIWNNANKNPLNTFFPGAGTAIGALKTGFAIARSVAASRRVISQKFEHGGGVLTGPRHAQGGIPIEAEGGEFIFSRRAVRALGANTLSRLNNAYTFSNGGPVNPYSNRAPMSRGRADSISKGDPFAAVDRLEKSFSEYAAKVDDWQRNIQVSNNLQETNKGLNVLNKLKRDADV